MFTGRSTLFPQNQLWDHLGITQRAMENWPVEGLPCGNDYRTLRGALKWDMPTPVRNPPSRIRRYLEPVDILVCSPEVATEFMQ